MFLLSLKVDMENPIAFQNNKFSSPYDACFLVNAADVSPSDSTAWILLKLCYEELRQTKPSRRNEV